MEVVEFIQTILVGGLATTLAVQFLKSNLIPMRFQDYPRLSALGVAIVATLVTIWRECESLVGGCEALVNQPVDYVAAVIGVFLVATVAYNNVMRHK